MTKEEKEQVARLCGRMLQLVRFAQASCGDAQRGMYSTADLMEMYDISDQGNFPVAEAMDGLNAVSRRLGEMDEELERVREDWDLPPLCPMA